MGNGIVRALAVGDPVGAYQPDTPRRTLRTDVFPASHGLSGPVPEG